MAQNRIQQFAADTSDASQNSYLKIGKVRQYTHMLFAVQSDPHISPACRIFLPGNNMQASENPA